VLGLLEQQRPDILILGDLGVANNRIGRLKLQLEASVDEEWVFLKNISNSPGYPVGIGAMVHVSAAKFITQLEVSCPPGLDQQEWALAVGGRILHLELNRPDADGRIWFVGLNQHVAANGRDQSREHVLSTLAHIANLAKTHGWKLVILGDANAAPPGGRWGYSYNTRTGAADKRMNDWQAHTELCEICSTPLQPTWKACLLPKKATLDRAWVYPVDLPVSKLLVKWAVAQPVFDHAMIMLQLPHTVAGLGFAAACRPLNPTIQAQRCRVNVRKFREPAIRAEWSKLLQLALTNIPDGSVAEQQRGLDPGELQRAVLASENGSAAVSGSNMQGCSESITGAAADGDTDMEPRGDLKEVAGDSTDVPVEMAGCDSDLLNGGNSDAAAEQDDDGVPVGRSAEVVEQDPLDPFQALQYAEMIAGQIAQSLAPRRQRKQGEFCRSFAFSGHRAIFREINLLNAARTLVKKIQLRSPDIVHCAHRDMLWNLKIRRLYVSIARSGHYRPSQLNYSTSWYFGDAANMVLSSWLDQAKTALDVRWAAVREDFAKAKYINECKARNMLIRSGGKLDTRLLANALGKRQPRPRMWGVAGQISLGISFHLSRENPAPLLAYLLALPETEGVVSVEGADSTLKIWFRGPRQMGDFIASWCSLTPPFDKPIVHTMVPSQTYVAIIPDDILAVQELHLAGEGMDSESICPSCQKTGIQPIVTSATAQPFGNPKRAVRFFCPHCSSVHDDVTLAQLPPCPIPWQVWKDMRKIPSGNAPLICRQVDMDTLETIVRRLSNDLSMGIDGIPREFYKYGPLVFLEFLRSAINAYMNGMSPTTGVHEWQGAIFSLISKTLAPLSMHDQRPIASECTKYSIFTTVVNSLLDQATEDHCLIDDAQEGFRRHRSTRRQLSKLRTILEQHSKEKSQSVVLYLDIKNAFNAVNHRAVLALLEGYGFHPADVDLFRRMYNGRFISVGNAFGETAACFLRRGVFQGDAPSPKIFTLAFDPVHKMVRASGRGCTVAGLKHPAGSSGFADDTILHTGGADAIPAMRVLVDTISPFSTWLGMFFNLKKSLISAIDYSTGHAMPTDSITFHGAPFTVLLPTVAHKHLGVRMSLTLNFGTEKAHVIDEMQRRLNELQKEEVLSPSLKELTIKIGVTSVFRYSAGVVPWLQSELDTISTMWIRGYKRAWFKSGARSMDSSPIVLDLEDGGRGCPSAPEVWMHEVLATIDQCLTLPGEIAQIILQHLCCECHAHGCAALNQMQLLLRLGGRAESGSLLGQILLRLDEQGLSVTSPWPQLTGILITEVVWPQLHQAWRAKELTSAIDRSAPLFSDGEAQAVWEQAKLCLQALRKLGAGGILELSKLYGQAGRWLAWREGHLRDCGLTQVEHATLLSWLDSAQSSANKEPEKSGADCSEQPPAVSQRVERIKEQDPDNAPCVELPPCICGLARSNASHDRIVLECSPNPLVGTRLGDVSDLHCISDIDLAWVLCRSRAVFSFAVSDSKMTTVECLLPLRAVLSLVPVFAPPECILVQNTAAKRLSRQFTVLTVPFIRDCLLACGAETLQVACRRDAWMVPCSDLRRWYTYSHHSSSSSQWVLGSSGPDGQQVLGGIERSLCLRRVVQGQRVPSLLHPWQLDPPLPPSVRIDLSNHFPQFLPSPEGWNVCKRNGRITITGPEHIAVGMDAAQYGMLFDQKGHACHEAFLNHVVSCCRSQDTADGEYHVPWSRHLLACLRGVLETDVLVGARAVTYHPHFAHFCSPEATDAALGADMDWEPLATLLLLDSFAPENRLTILDQALQHVLQHDKAVWILRSDQPSAWAPNDNKKLRELKARIVAILPAKSLILHDIECWSYAKWDSKPSRYNAHLWLLCPASMQAKSPADLQRVQTSLGDWDARRYDFHHSVAPITLRLQAHRSHQQDALRFSVLGTSDYFAGTDGSGQRQYERQGSGFVVTHGDILAPVLQFFTPVGGPFASTRVEAVALLCLLEQIRANILPLTRLIVFTDSLCLLDILSKWGRNNFWPGPKDVIHFDVLLPLLKILRGWATELVLVKVKGHTGCFHNELADEQADKGCAADAPRLYNGPQKYGTLHLRIQPFLRELISTEHARAALPSDLVPNKLILRQTVRANQWRSVRLRSTIFARDLVQTEYGLTVASIISKQKDSEIRCWMQSMTGTYPVATYLKRIGKVPTNVCPHCSSQQIETFTHFMSICPRFHDARVAAHNQIRECLSTALYKALPKGWVLHEETPMSKTGLRLTPVPTVLVQNSGRSVQESDIEAGSMHLGRWQPDLLLVSYTRRKIAIMDVIRPSDIRRERLQTAHLDKLRTYEPLCQALSVYADSNWEVQVLPWVVGTRGLVQYRALASALEFLEAPRCTWKQVIESTVQAAVAALVFMHRVRFSQSLLNHTSVPKLDEVLLRRGTKRKASSTGGEFAADMMRCKRMAVDTWRRQ
jgi:ribonuclease HI